MNNPMIEEVEIERPQGATRYRRMIYTDGRTYYRWEHFGGGWKRVPGDQWHVLAEIDARLGNAIDHTPGGDAPW